MFAGGSWVFFPTKFQLGPRRTRSKQVKLDATIRSHVMEIDVTWRLYNVCMFVLSHLKQTWSRQYQALDLS